MEIRAFVCVFLVGCGGAVAVEPFGTIGGMAGNSVGGGGGSLVPDAGDVDAEIDADITDIGDGGSDAVVVDVDDPIVDGTRRTGAACIDDVDCAYGFAEESVQPHGFCVDRVCRACSDASACAYVCEGGAAEGQRCPVVGGGATACAYCVDHPDIFCTFGGGECPSGECASATCE